MRLKRAFLTLCILALLLGCYPTAQGQAMRAAPPPAGRNTADPAAGPLAVRSDASKVETPTPQGIQSSATGDWHIECVDCPKHFDTMTDRSLRLDDDGHPHIAYGGDHLYYAWHDGETWQYETVDNAPGVGSGVALALDAAGNPHISYYDKTNIAIKYAHWTNNTWDIQIVDSKGAGGAALVLDAADHPHLVYQGSGGLTYAHWTGNAWDIQTVDDANVGGYWPHIALDLDAAGTPHIAYRGQIVCDQMAFFGPKYAHWTGSSWDLQTVECDGAGGYEISLALDTAGNPHVSYHGTHPDILAMGLKYAYWTGSTWDVETVSGSMDSNRGISLALDAVGTPHISYYFYDLMYAHRTSDTWDIQTVDSEGDVGWDTSLVLDSVGNPHISYCVSTNLKYAHWTGSIWNVQTVDNGADTGRYTSLALDAAGHPAISYFDRTNSALKYAYRVDSVWRTQTVYSRDVSGYRHTKPSLILDAAGNPHISYTDWDNLDLQYTRWTGSTWDTQTVDSEGDIGWTTSLALDAAGNPHISYFDYTNNTLKYAYWAGSAWDIQTVDSELDAGRYTSLALDAAGNPHIGYTDWISPALKYAHWTGHTWDIQTMDSEEEVVYVSLALDAAGDPHISYFDDSNDDLKYAYWTGSAWDIQTIDSEGDVGRYTSLALDAADNPHISYSDNTNNAPKYARWTGSTWDIQTLDSEGSAVQDISLALDAAGNAHISYYDLSNKDLKYVRLFSPLTLNKKATPHDGLHINDTLTYTLTFSSPAVSVRLWDPLPDNVAYITGSVTSTLSPPAIYSPTARAIVWQGTLPTDTMQVVRFQVVPTATGTLVISGTAELPLSPIIVNTAWLTDTEYGRIISSTAIVNGKHVYLPLVMRQYPSLTVLWMHLNEPEGATIFSDSSVYGNHGTCSGTSCPTAGVAGSTDTALHFDGSDDYITLGNPASMNFDGEITIEAWVNVEATDGIRNIVAHGYTTYPQAEVFVRIQDGRYEVGSWDGTSHKATFDIPAEDIGSWVYLVGVHDGTAWRLYRNGVEVSSTVDGIGTVPVNGSWALGARGTGDERFFQGGMDEVAIHSRALSDQEILDRYYEGGVANRVVPIDWQRFDQTIPQDQDFDESVAILLNSTRYNTAWIEQTFDENPKGDMYVLTDTSENGIRPATSAVYGLATVLRTGIFDQDVIGVSEEQVASRAVKLIKGVAAIHEVNGNPGVNWGDSWQSALWASMLGQAGWMLWEDLDVEAQHWLASAIEYEANRFIEPDYQVPYWNGVGGDSKAEENAWNALLLQVAVAMMPDAPQVPQWKRICSELMVSAFAREEDMQNDTLFLDGQSVQEWLNGYNLRADGVVINHNLIHNDYMSTITFNMHAILSQSLAGRPVPEAADFNFDVVYHSLVTNYFPSPPYQEPGGTMYIPGFPEQYYPQGTDWSHYRFDIFYVMDVYAHIFEYDSGLAYTAQHWMRLRAQKIFEMQSRHADGHIYAPGEYDTYPGCEQLAIWQMTDAFLLHWLYWQDSISETANWLAGD